MDTDAEIVPTSTDGLATRAGYTPTGLNLPDDLTFDEWETIGNSLEAISVAWQWWYGDWWNFGESRYGQEHAQGLPDKDYSTKSHAASISRSIEVSRRRLNLSFSHHAEVASLEPDDQDRWLDRAEAEAWSVRDLRDAVRMFKASEPKLPVVVEASDAKGDGWSVLVGDFRDRLADKKLRGTVDMIVTDPPYPKNDLHLYRDLAAIAVDLLHPRGLLVTYAGSMFIPEVLDLLREGGLTYGWTFCLLMDEGSRSRIMGRHIMQAWKPLFVFTKGTWPSGRWVGDVVKSAGRDKSLYEWQQDAVAARDIIERLAPVRGRVVDPFLGVGSFGVAAIEADREFIGVEQDGGRAASAIERMRDAEKEHRRLGTD